ncbi:MAG: hypothetical protein D6730_01520 [Bacteroidetes bacterium]|nr:MAG: hypothetical protein D6730_01520 [Bacteroidota bacterium]
MIPPGMQAQELGVKGKVFVDHNGNALMDGADYGHPVIRVHLYLDTNDNGRQDGADRLLATQQSGPGGWFELTHSGQGLAGHKLLLAPDSADLPPSARISTPVVVFPADSVPEQVQIGFQGQAVLCYAIGDGSSPDKLMMVNRISGIQQPFIGGLGTRYVESMAVSPGGKSIFAVNKEKLGKIDMKTGDFRPLPDTLGTGRGSEGIHHFQDADALAFDPFSGRLYATERRAFKRDLLFQLDTLSGKIVKDAFGPGQDYVLLEGKNVQAEMDGLAISPLNGKMYGINNFSNVTYYDFLVEIDKHTGATRVIDTIKLEGKYLHDIEGLGFSNDGELVASTGTSAAEGHTNRLFSIDLRDASARLFSALELSSDYESCDCLTSAPNRIRGKVFEDLNENHLQDSDETGLEGIGIYVYKDNGDRKIGRGDILLDSLKTGKDGHYEWVVAASLNFLLELNMKDLPAGYEYMGPRHHYVGMAGSIGGELAANKDFGVAHGSYLREWFSFSEEKNPVKNMLASNAPVGRGLVVETEEFSGQTKTVEPQGFTPVGTVAGAVALAGASDEMRKRAAKPVLLQRMSMKDGDVVGVRLKHIDKDALPLSAAKEGQDFVELRLPGMVGPAITSRLLSHLATPRLIRLKNTSLKPGLYYLQVFNRKVVCMKKILVE